MSSLIFGNGTYIVHWEPSCRRRGTFDILSTCIITLLLCVWTAVHLNVSPPGTIWRSRLRKVGWLVLALLAPEMVAYTAWYAVEVGVATRNQTPRLRLTSNRYQRQQALSIMRAYNNAWVLPNPRPWYGGVFKKIKKALLSPRRWSTPPRQKSVLVSRL